MTGILNEHLIGQKILGTDVDSLLELLRLFMDDYEKFIHI